MPVVLRVVFLAVAAALALATQGRADDDASSRAALPAPAPPEALPDPLPAGPAPGGGPVLDLTLKEGSYGRSIPWDQLDRTSYLRVRDVVTEAFAAREVRAIAFRSRPGVFEFLFDHPDFASEVGLALREGKYRLQRVGDAYEVDDGLGAHGRLRQLLSDGGRRLYYIEGRYEGAMLPTFSGRLVVVLDTEHLPGPDGETYCHVKFAGFVKFDQGLLDIVMRATRSLSESRVDRKVRSFFRHVAAVSRRAYDDPEGLADQLEGRPELSPELLDRFRRVLTAHLPPRWVRVERFRLLDEPLTGDDPVVPPAVDVAPESPEGSEPLSWAAASLSLSEDGPLAPPE
jgi:hypothetical protein